MITQAVLFLLQTSGASSSKSPILGYIPIALLLIVVLLLPLLLWALSGLLNRKAADEEQPATDDLSIPSSGSSSDRFAARFFVLGILYLVFAAQVVFLLPWAVIYDRLALFGLVEMLVFMLFVGIGYYYVWYTGVLDEPDIATD